MAKKATIYQSVFPYHITARCINKERFEVPIEEVWSLASNYLHTLATGFNFRIHAFVLMNNHYHLLATTPDSNIAQGMNYFQREVSREISRRANRINQTWGGPYDPCVVASNRHLKNVYRYVYQNPIRAGLAKRCEDYPYSTLHALLGQRHTIIPIHDEILFDPEFSWDVLEWLNETYGEKADVIRMALKKPKFKMPKCPQSNRPLSPRGHKFFDSAFTGK